MDHLLHGITLFSVVITAIGFLFLSYDFLDRPHGILRWLIQVIVPGVVFALPWSILAFFLPGSWMLGPFSLKDIATNFAFYGGLIGFFNGLFADPPDKTSSQLGDVVPDRRISGQLPLAFGVNDAPEDLALLASAKRNTLRQSSLDFDDASVFMQMLRELWKQVSWVWKTLLRDGMIGFLFASSFWFVETFLILGYPFYDFTFDSLARDYVGFAVVGAVGGSLWRFIHRVPYGSADEPRFFSLKNCLVGLVVWTVTYLLICLMSLPVFTLIWHTGFVVPVGVLLGVALIVLAGGVSSGFSRFVFYKLNSLRKESPHSLSSQTTYLKSKGGASLDLTTHRITRKLTFGLPLPSLKENVPGLVSWFMIWLVTGLGILTIATPVLPILTDINYPSGDSFDPQVVATFMAQHFLFVVIIGTAITVLIGSFTVALFRFIFRFRKVAISRSRSTRKPSPLSSSIVPENSDASGSGQFRTSLINMSPSYLYDGFNRLASWYEIWFVFAAVLITFSFFKDWGIPVVVLVGTTITVLVGSMFRFFAWRGKHKRHLMLTGQQALFSSRDCLMKPVFWPLLWLAIGVVVIMTFLSADWSSFSNIPQSIPSVKTLELFNKLIIVEEQRFILVEEQRFFLMGTAITVLAGGTLFLLLRFLFWLTDRLRSSFIGKHSFQNILKRRLVRSIHIFVLRALGNNPDQPFFFSLREGFLRLAFWTGTWFMCGAVVFIAFAFYDAVIHGSPVTEFDASFLLYGLLGTLAIALAGAVTGGFSASIPLWATGLPQKRLGVLGIVLTLFGFLLQLVEPTVLLAYRPPTHGHTDSVLAVAWSPDGTRIASASADQTVQVWTIGLEGNVLTYRGHFSGVKTLSWSPNGKYIVSGSQDGAIQLWDTATGRTVSNNGVSPGNMYAVAWSPSGNRIASSGDNGHVFIWNTTKKDGANTVVDFRSMFPLDLQDRPTKVTDLAWSPDGKLIAATSNDGEVRVWKVTNTVFDSPEIFASPFHSGTLLAVTWAPDNRRIAVAGSGNAVQVWDVTTKKNVPTYSSGSIVNDVAWSPDGKRIAFASAYGTVGIVDPTAKGSQLLMVYRGHFNSVNALAWSSDSVRIASASDDKTVQIWDAITGEHIFTFSSSGLP